MPGKRYVEQNLFLAYAMLDKTYSWHWLCSTKPISGIHYGRQNHIWDLVETRIPRNAVSRLPALFHKIEVNLQT